jgi:pimeloyl-ACP methyl ester carboxylesterase
VVAPTANVPRSSVRAQLEEPGRELLLDVVPGSGTLLLLFGGLAPRAPEPRFEYTAATGLVPSTRRTFAPVPVTRCYVRDLSRTWYHRGVRGLGGSIEDAAEALIALARRLDVERVACLGTSSGGYAALLFGSLICADSVHAISPQTFLSAEARAARGDTRWEPHATALQGDPARSEQFFDLEHLYRSYPGRTRAVVHYATCDRVDSAHAEALPGVELRAYDMAEPERHVAGGHALIFDLRDDGTLSQILLEAAGLASAPAPVPRRRTGATEAWDTFGHDKSY